MVWVCSLLVIGLVGDDGVAIGTPLSVIRNWGKMNKIDQV